MATSQTTCLIPFYNEGERLHRVLKVVAQVKNLKEIVCVDDASEPNTIATLESLFPSVRFIRLEQNQGKSGALRAGLPHCTGRYVLLLDADLNNLNALELESAIDAQEKNPQVDMLILRRINAPKVLQWTRGEILFTGERIVAKQDLDNVLRGPVEGWQIESALNHYMYERNKKVMWMPHSATNTRKPWKFGLVKGVQRDLLTLSDMITVVGAANIVRHTLYFAREELKTPSAR